MPDPDPAPATITAAAYCHEGVVYTLPPPARHCHIIWEYGDFPSFESGFITSDGEFVDREKAFKIASAAGQVKRQAGGYNGPELFTEDLW